MPVYVYKNLNTGERFEFEQRITEPPLEQHPETGDPVKRLVQPVGIAFKGSGFYVTDSRAGAGSSVPSKKASGSDSTGKADTADKADGGTKKESKSDAGGSGAASATAS